MTDLLDALEARAERGVPRGADEVWARTRSVPRRSTDRPRRVAAVLAAAVVLALVAAAVLAVRRDDPAEEGPTDVSPAPEVGAPEPVEPPLFGRETQTALIVASDFGEGIAIDLDSGIARSLPMVTDVDDMAVVGGQLVFASSLGLSSAPVDGSAPATLLTATPNGREVGVNDTFAFAPSGDAGPFWVESGPIADAPERSFLAGEHDLSGATTAGPIDLGRTDRTLRGATANYVLVSDRADDAEVQVLDHSGAVVRTLPGLVDAGGERIVWAEDGEYQVWDVANDVEGSLAVPDGVDLSIGGELSPDGSQLAVGVQTEDGPVLGVVNIEDGDFWIPQNARIDSDLHETVWSPDGRWVFASGGLTAPHTIIGYRVGAEDGTTITIPGLAIWSMVAAPAIPPPAGQVEPCPAVVSQQEACALSAFAGTSAPQAPPTDTTVIVDDADSPLDPRNINVLVANGSGFAGAAGAVSDTLAELGYVTVPPTNTVVDTAATPLDTVYYATNPDTRVQAEQVASDLGLPDDAVLPYPGGGEGPAPIGLAQVLVVLGSAPGQLASVLDGPTAYVDPEARLSDGDAYEITGVGFEDGQGVMVIQCAVDETGDGSWCDPATAVSFPTPGGAVDGMFTVHQVLQTAQRRVDCADHDCVVVLGGIGTNTTPIRSDVLVFA